MSQTPLYNRYIATVVKTWCVCLEINILSRIDESEGHELTYSNIFFFKCEQDSLSVRFVTN